MAVGHAAPPATVTSLYSPSPLPPCGRPTNTNLPVRRRQTLPLATCAMLARSRREVETGGARHAAAMIAELVLLRPIDALRNSPWARTTGKCPNRRDRLSPVGKVQCAAWADLWRFDCRTDRDYRERYRVPSNGTSGTVVPCRCGYAVVVPWPPVRLSTASRMRMSRLAVTTASAASATSS